MLFALTPIVSFFLFQREPSARELGALNLFVCLVARYFRQLDLADP